MPPKALGGKARVRAIYFAVQRTWIKCNELALRIHTEPLDETSCIKRNPVQNRRADGNSSKAKHGDAFAYAAPDYWCIYRVARVLKPTNKDVFYDLGAGMGRVICVMARYRLRKCIAVELSEEMCQIARWNASHVRGKRAPIDIVCYDAALADVSEGTIYYMYNPFGPKTLTDVLANIQQSVLQSPRNIRIVYYNSIHESVFQSCAWLEKYSSFRTFTGREVSFWRNCTP